MKNKRGFFLVSLESFLNRIISFFDYSYCPVCKKIVLRTEEGRRGEKIEGGEKVYFQKKCPICKKALEEVHAFNNYIMKKDRERKIKK